MEIGYKAEPTPAEFHQSDAFFRCIVGPLGSGKSVAATMELLHRAVQQQPGPDGVRRTRFAVVRNLYGELKSTTMNTFKDWVPEKICKITMDSPIKGEIKFDLGDGTSVDCEVLFMALDQPKDTSRLLSLELTGVWFNEVREIHPEIIDAATGRVGRYPAKRDGGPTWSGIFADTNPFDDDSTLYKWAEIERPEGYEFFKQPPALLETQQGYKPNPKAENVQNQPLGFDYWLRMVQGKSDDWIRVYVLGKYGTTQEGKPVFPEFRDETHVANQELTPIRNVDLMLGWDYGLCYDDQTEVLTDHGWRLFKDVDETVERAATRNPETGGIEYQPINFKVDRPHNGDMLEWSNSSIDLCVTPEHRIPFSYRDTPDDKFVASADWIAQHMTGHHYVDLRAEWNPEPDDTPVFGMAPTTFAEFMGIYLSEGSTDGPRISIAQKEEDPYWREVLDLTGRQWQWQDGPNPGWRTRDADLAGWLAGFGHSHDKFVPDRIKQMTPSQIEKFIWRYTEGDGNFRQRPNGSYEHTIATASKRMADDLQELALKVGWNASIRWVDPQTSIITEDGVEREIQGGGIYQITFKKRAQRAEFHSDSFRRFHYEGRVYCLNVPNHTLYVRRNGKAHWNGNSPACVAIQLTPRGQLRIIDEWAAEDMSIQQLARDVVAPDLSRKYPDWRIESWGDPGGGRSETDGKTARDILREQGIPTRSAPTNKIQPRLEAVRHFLNKMVDGQPGLLVSPKCDMVRKGLRGRYFYERVQVVGEARYKDQPCKNRYSHTMDALQYAALGIDRRRMSGRKPNYSPDTYKPASTAGY